MYIREFVEPAEKHCTVIRDCWTFRLKFKLPLERYNWKISRGFKYNLGTSNKNVYKTSVAARLSRFGWWCGDVNQLAFERVSSQSARALSTSAGRGNCVSIVNGAAKMSVAFAVLAVHEFGSFRHDSHSVSVACDFPLTARRAHTLFEHHSKFEMSNGVQLIEPWYVLTAHADWERAGIYRTPHKTSHISSVGGFAWSGCAFSWLFDFAVDSNETFESRNISLVVRWQATACATVYECAQAKLTDWQPVSLAWCYFYRLNKRFRLLANWPGFQVNRAEQCATSHFCGLFQQTANQSTEFDRFTERLIEFVACPVPRVQRHKFIEMKAVININCHQLFAR